MGFVKSRTQYVRRPPCCGAASDDEEIQICGDRKDARQHFAFDLNGRANRPCPNPVGQTKQRTPMRHSSEAKTTRAVSVDEHLPWQMRLVH
jgi:hypothetical protein